MYQKQVEKTNLSHKMITSFHAKYFAHELTRQHGASDVGRLSQSHKFYITPDPRKTQKARKFSKRYNK